MEALFDFLQTVGANVIAQFILNFLKKLADKLLDDRR